MAKLASIAVGGSSSLRAGNGGDRGTIDVELNLATHPLPVADVRPLAFVPAGSVIQAYDVEVDDADSVAAGTADVGLYKVSDDTAIDDDGIINELPVGALGRTMGAPAAVTGQYVAQDAWIGMKHGAAGGAEYADGHMFLRFWVLGPAPRETSIP